MLIDLVAHGWSALLDTESKSEDQVYPIVHQYYVLQYTCLSIPHQYTCLSPPDHKQSILTKEEKMRAPLVTSLPHYQSPLKRELR